MGGSGIFIVAVKCLLASTIMGFIIHYFYQSLDHLLPNDSTLIAFFKLGLTISLGGGAYLTVLFLLKTEELKWVVSVIQKKFLRGESE